jgi:hypothetical protein
VLFPNSKARARWMSRTSEFDKNGLPISGSR